MRGSLLSHIHGTYCKAGAVEPDTEESTCETIPADRSVKNCSYTLVDGDVYYRENSVMVRSKLSATAADRVKGMIRLRECVQQLIDLQLDEYTPDSALQLKGRGLFAAICSI